MKSLKINENVWQAVKIWCAKNSHSIQWFTETALLEKLKREPISDK